MAIFLISGVAGFIGARVKEMLLSSGYTLVGVDNMNNSYDVRMKEYCLELLKSYLGFTFNLLDISDFERSRLMFRGIQFDAVINLAARVGVRASVGVTFCWHSLRGELRHRQHRLYLLVEHWKQTATQLAS
jgi:nucleoside-diphosphate-sugar epimerase